MINYITVGDSQLYEKFYYPAGEMQIRLNPEYFSRLRSNEEIFIISRIYNADDIIETLLLCDAFRNQSVYLKLPYLPYSRADRRFTEGDCFGLKMFLMPFLNSPCIDKIITLDIHNIEAIKEINSFGESGFRTVTLRNFVKNIDPTQFIIKVLSSISNDYINIMFPDEEAHKRYRELASHNPYRCRSYSCKKERDHNGRLTKVDVPEMHSDDPILIVDDICDGGATFIEIAKQIQARNLHDKSHNDMYLYATHGIFSQGIACLMEKFKKIFTTDSYEHRINSNSNMGILNEIYETKNNGSLVVYETNDIWSNK